MVNDKINEYKILEMRWVICPETGKKKGFYIGFPKELISYINLEAESQFTTKVSIVRQFILKSYKDENFDTIKHSDVSKKLSKPWNYAEVYVTLPEPLYQYIETLCNRSMLTRTAVIRQIVGYYYNQEDVK